LTDSCTEAEGFLLFATASRPGYNQPST